MEDPGMNDNGTLIRAAAFAHVEDLADARSIDP